MVVVGVPEKADVSIWALILEPVPLLTLVQSVIHTLIAILAKLTKDVLGARTHNLAKHQILLVA